MPLTRLVTNSERRRGKHTAFIITHQCKGGQGHLVHSRLKDSRDVIIESPVHVAFMWGGELFLHRPRSWHRQTYNVLLLLHIAFAYLILITV